MAEVCGPDGAGWAPVEERRRLEQQTVCRVLLTEETSALGAGAQRIQRLGDRISQGLLLQGRRGVRETQRGAARLRERRKQSEA